MDSRAFVSSMLCVLIALHAADVCSQSVPASAAPTDAQPTQLPQIESIDELLASRDRANRIMVPVMVNDQGPFSFMLDTGANQSAVSPHLVKALNLELAATPTTRLRGVTGEAIVPRVKVRKLQAGTLVMQDLQLAVIGATLTGIDGVLGVDGFRNKRVAVHIAGNRVTIERSSDVRAPPEYPTFPITLRHGQLAVVAANVGGVAIKAVIDTGSQGTLGNEKLRQVLALQAPSYRMPNIAQVQGVTGTTQLGETHFTPTIRFKRADDPRFEAVEVYDATVTYGDFYVFDLWGLVKQPALLVGVDILSTMEEVVIDYGRKELQLKARRAQ